MKNLLLISALGATLCLAGCQNQRANVEGSRDTAVTWVAEVLPDYEIVGFSSATLDTDEDGYVSAEISVRKKGTEGPLKLIQLECPTKGILLQWQKGGTAKLKMVPMNNEF